MRARGLFQCRDITVIGWSLGDQVLGAHITLRTVADNPIDTCQGQLLLEYGPKNGRKPINRQNRYKPSLQIV